jgi:hypothetical protein
MSKRKSLISPKKKCLFSHKKEIVGNYNISTDDIIILKVAKVLQNTKSVG